ncbi:MAG: hypothetical protein AAGF30_04070 [Pseudomonadota bacterium]
MTYPISPRDPRVHVFSVSDGALKLDHQTYLSRLTDPGDGPSLDEAFGAEIDETYAEVFAIADIAPMSLRDYLAQAHDIYDETLAADAAKLDSLSGDVVVLAPRALRRAEALQPRSELTPIGAYAPVAANDAMGDLPKASLDPAPSPEATMSPPPQGSRRTLIAVIVLAFVVTLGMLILL